jgi:phosphonate metabolism-associated iron-containing alcohol dehydrogenase
MMSSLLKSGNAIDIKTTWTHYNPARVTAGPGAIEKLFSLTPSDPPLSADGRILLVTTQGFTDRGTTAQIQLMAVKHLGITEKSKNSILVYDQVNANPEIDDLDNITQEFRKRNIEWIIALGGGSVLDAAKVLSVTLNDAPAVSLNTVLRRGTGHEWKSPIPVVAIPTTAGTGAEVTPFATVWDSKNQKKYSVAGDALFPAHALIDPELTLTLSPKDTLYTGLDAVSHALESLWNKNRTPVSETFALKALALANAALPAVLKHAGVLNNHPAGSDHPADSIHMVVLRLREKMQQAALLAGLAISQTRTAIAHAVSYPITLRFGVPHGLACSFTLPGLIKHYTAGMVNPDHEPITTAMHQTLATLENLNLKNEIAPYIREKDLSQYIDEMFHPERAGNYAKPITRGEIENLIN